MNQEWKIISDGIPVGFFQSKWEAINALQLYVKNGYVVEKK